MKSLSREQLKALMLAIPNPRFRLMILVGFWHGLRVSELVSLRGRQIQDGFLSVKRLKRSKKTIQPLVFNTDPVFDELTPLTELCKTIGDDELLFPMTRDGVLKLMKRAGKVAGVPVHLCHPHALKHTIAMTMMRSKKKNVKEIQEYLGHVEGKNTMKYFEATMEEAAAGLGDLI